MVDKLSDVISKVKKLLNVAKRSDKPGEVAAAQGLAQALITKYQLEESQLIGERLSNEIIEKIVLTQKPYVVDKSILLNSIAKHNFCKVLRGKGYCVIYGTETDIELCLALYDTLLPHMLSEMEYKLEKYKATTTDQVHAKAWIKSFFSGYCVNISERIKQSKNEVVKEAESNGMSVVVIVRDKQHAIEDYFQRLDYNSASEYSINSESGYREGVASADEADLNQNNVESE